MNTFKTTACMLLLTTAGFAVDMPGGGDDGDENFNPNKFTLSAPSTPVKAKVHSPLNTPQQQDQFVTPDQMIRLETPDAPLRAYPVATSDSDSFTPGRLVGTVTSSPDFKKRKVAEVITILHPKGSVLFSYSPKGQRC